MKLNLKIIIPVAVVVIAALVVAKKKGWIGEGADTVAVETGYAHRRTVRYRSKNTMRRSAPYLLRNCKKKVQNTSCKAQKPT